jgi:hypothetical protein
MAKVRSVACVILSILTFIAAIILLVTASVFVHRISYLRQFWTLIFALSITSIIIASLAIIFAIGFLYVVRRQFPALTTLFSSLLVIIVFLSAVCAIILLVDRSNIRSRSFDNTRRLIVNYASVNYSRNLQSIMDRIQQDYSCCGVDKATDWIYPTFNPASTPDSCCIKVTPNCGNNSLIKQDTIYLRGCAEPVYANYRERYTSLIGMNFNLMVLSLITAILGFAFERTIRDQYQAM